MRIALCAALAVLITCVSCSSTKVDNPPQIVFTNISGVYGADVEQRNLGRLTMTLDLVKDTHTVYKAELTNLVGDTQTKVEGIGTLANYHLILNFDRGKTTDFYFESKVVQDSDGFLSLDGNFIFPDSAPNVPAVFNQPLSGN